MRTNPPRRPRPGADEDVLVVPVCRRRDITGVGLLVAYLAVTAPRIAHVVCDVGGATRCDTDAVGALARIALEGRRRGVRVWVRNPTPALVALVDLVGLTDALPVLDRDEDSAEDRVGDRSGDQAAGRGAHDPGPTSRTRRTPPDGAATTG